MATAPIRACLRSRRSALILEKVLHDYRTGLRKSREMAAMSSVLTEMDVDNLAAHYASQIARAIVFVPVPAK